MGRYDVPFILSKKGHRLTPRPIGVKKLKIPQRLFFVHGYPECGKSMIISRVLEKLRSKHPQFRVQGFYQREVWLKRELIGLETVSVNGPSRLMCSMYPIPNSMTNPPPLLGKHRVDVKGFESIALPELKLHHETELFIVDEIGRKELMSESFYAMLEDVLNAEIPVLGALARTMYWEDLIKPVEKIIKRPDAKVYTVHNSTKYKVAKTLYQRLQMFYQNRKEEGRDHLKRNH